MRNFIEHFSFMITGGYKPSTLMVNKGAYFYQNFFGDMPPLNTKSGDGRVEAMALAAVKMVSAPSFGSCITPQWKRNLFHDRKEEVNDKSFEYSCPDLIRSEFETLKERCCRVSSIVSLVKAGRLAIARIHYFMNTIKDPVREEEFVSSFLGSPGFSYLEEFSQHGQLSRARSKELMDICRHRLREAFLGMKLSSVSDQDDAQFYITMARDGSEVSQTSQIVENQFTWDNRSHFEYGSDGMLRLAVRLDGEYKKLDMPLPFLDYLIRGEHGIVDDTEYDTYEKRLNQFKDKLRIDDPYGAYESSLSVVYLNIKHEVKKTDFMIDAESNKIQVY